ncbi:DUF4034 domain-containing protein [Lentzea sp. NBRC 102530]|uniref:DUF4034 domain-containing protein n=1 Tax=Lentzea sp. NBRC 102530 TaxID=3032201 RepID=UPI0024A0CCD5|nr:DUF4034 domain-containing protein [Lentzea sp. NBRC 102530]GLY49379.1 hypothetical protein Lesp01_30350 [Lentzea sp. NBRC 102530]
MVLSLLFKPKELVRVFRLMREAKRRGVELDELPDDVVASFVLPKTHPERYGLVPDDEVSTTSPLADLALAAVKDDVRAGNWENAADLVAATEGDWDRRDRVVWALADLAAKDDAWMQAWIEARPGDPHWIVVHSRALVALAWEIRGSARASETTREQFDGFHRVLFEAREAASIATSVLPDDPTPWNTLLTLGRGLQVENDEFRALWAELVARDPLHYSAHGQALQYWCRKWFGSDALALEFALEAAAKSPKFLGLPLQAAYEADNSETNMWKDPSVVRSLDALLDRLADEGADTYALRHDRGYAIFGLMQLRRFEEAVGQFRALGAVVDAGPWDYFEDPRLSFLSVRGKAITEMAKGRGVKAPAR